MDTNGTNFHKMIKGLSTNALKYLVNLASKELKKRSKNSPIHENKELPILSFNNSTILKIKNEYFTIYSHSIDNENYKTNNEIVNLDVKQYDWMKMYIEKNPITLTLRNRTTYELKEIALESRSKIIWLSKLLNEQTIADISTTVSESYQLDQ